MGFHLLPRLMTLNYLHGCSRLCKQQGNNLPNGAPDSKNVRSSFTGNQSLKHVIDIGNRNMAVLRSQKMPEISLICGIWFPLIATAWLSYYHR